MNPQISKIPEILWLVASILALVAAVHKLYTANNSYLQYFIISGLSVLMYLYRRNRRKNA